MLRLMKLEVKKFKLGWYWKGAMIVTILISAFILMVSLIEQLYGNVLFQDIEDFFIVVSTFVRSVFIVFAAVLVSKMIIEEFKQKTMAILFTYPIDRQKIIRAKIWLIFLLTFVTIVVVNCIVLIILFLIHQFYPFIPGQLTLEIVWQQLLFLITFAFGAAGTSLIVLFFGMRSFSVPATVISSLLLIAVTSNHNPVFSIASIVYIPLFLAVIGFLIANWSIRKVKVLDM